MCGGGGGEGGPLPLAIYRELWLLIFDILWNDVI